MSHHKRGADCADHDSRENHHPDHDQKQVKPEHFEKLGELASDEK